MDEPETKEQREAKRIKVFEEGVCHVCGEPLDQIQKVYEARTTCRLIRKDEFSETEPISKVIGYKCYKCEARLPIHMDMQMTAVLGKHTPLQDK